MNPTRSTLVSKLPLIVAKPLAIGGLALLAMGCAVGGEEDDGRSSSAAQGSGGAGAETGVGGAGAGGAAGAAGAESGGAGGTAATTAGGAAGAAGAAGAGGGQPPPVCKDDEKLCTTGCVTKGPENGCGSTGCAPCGKPPANSKPTCDGALCEFECLPGFARSGFACVPEGTGGSGGSGGSGGASGGAGGSGGGLQVCVAPCTPSDPKSQFLCLAACVSKGGAGLCAPALNCCVCG